MSVLIRLAAIADELDNCGLTEEANAVDQVLMKLAQSQPVPQWFQSRMPATAPTYSMPANRSNEPLPSWLSSKIPANSAYDPKLIQAYLGWAYDALIKDKVATGNSLPRSRERLDYVRKALWAHAAKQSPQFQTFIPQQFDQTFGNQQVFQQNTQPAPQPAAAPFVTR